MSITHIGNFNQDYKLPGGRKVSWLFHSSSSRDTAHDGHSEIIS